LKVLVCACVDAHVWLRVGACVAWQARLERDVVRHNLLTLACGAYGRSATPLVIDG
jgi:hypothetical protein